jgi:hypothetical protein
MMLIRCMLDVQRQRLQIPGDADTGSVGHGGSNGKSRGAA